MRLLKASILLVLVGCVPSLHELYTDQTLVFDPSIAGQWHDTDGTQWEIAANAEEKNYTITIHESEQTQSKLLAHLVEIEGHRFFDLYPAKDAAIKTGDWIKAHLIAGHLFLKVETADSKLALAAMNPQTIDTLLKENPRLVKHERTKDRIILTDSPENLQVFVLAGLKIEGFFGDPITLERVAKTAPGPPQLVCVGRPLARPGTVRFQWSKA